MASFHRKILISAILLSSFQYLYTASSSEFNVGGDEGWKLPHKLDEGFYNDWASKNRFKVNDTIRFKYEKDSVMVVTEAEYEKCRSTHPLFFSLNGDTVYPLDRPGLFYFISGVSGHCPRGEKMIIKVLEPEAPPESPDTPLVKTSSATKATAVAVTSTSIIMLAMALADLQFH